MKKYMQVIADLQLHSKYSRAVSPQMTIPNIGLWSARKGIGLVATGDWTHPLWIREIQANLEEAGNGLLKLKDSSILLGYEKLVEPLFLLATEVSCIYSQGGKLRRVHVLIWVPTIASAEKIIEAMNRRGCKLGSDGRPIIGMTLIQISELVLSIEPKALLIPAHCLPSTEEVMNSDYSSTPIGKVKPGDMILSHKGVIRRVTKVMNRQYNGKLVRVRPWYFRQGLSTTPEHPYLAIRTLKKCPSTGDVCRPSKSHLRLCKRKTALGYKPEWIMAKDLSVGDVLMYPRIKPKRMIDRIDFGEGLPNSMLSLNSILAGGTRGRKVKRFLNVTPDFGKLIGYFLAEGSISNNSFSFCFSQREEKYVADVLEIVKKIWGPINSRIYRRKERFSIELVFDSKIHARWLASHCYQDGFAHKADVKKIPNFIFYSSLKVQAECLLGWYRGDKGYTVSRALMNQMKIICLNLDIIPSIIVDTKFHHLRRGNHKYGQRTIKARHDTYAFSNLAFFTSDIFGLKAEIKRSQTKIDRRHGWIDENYIYLPIKDITSSLYKGKVYNLEVESDHSYVTEFAAVHNCWTPWFSVFGSLGGFNTLEEAFGPFAKNIYAVETGLSSNPSMNWRIKELDNRSILSFSDAHSGPKIGREATVFELKDISYDGIYQAISQLSVLGSRLSVAGQPVVGQPIGAHKQINRLTDKQEAESRKQKTDNRIAYTIEFYPEEGKYHYTGHRNCGIKYDPAEAVKKGIVCPVCRRNLTQGVMQRVEELAGRTEEDLQLSVIGYQLSDSSLPVSQLTGQPKTDKLLTENRKQKTDNRILSQMIMSKTFPNRPPFAMLVPLQEIIAEANGSPVQSTKTQSLYLSLVEKLGGEFEVLLRAKTAEVAMIAGSKTAEGIEKVRSGDIVIDPGYDGVFGVAKIWDEGKPAGDDKEQLALFG